MKKNKDAELSILVNYTKFPFEILRYEKQWSHLMENRFADLQGQNNNL